MFSPSQQRSSSKSCPTWEQQRKIPEQRLPGWIRWPLRFLFLPFILFDQLIQYAIKLIIPPPYKRTGACHQCGRCCRYILIFAPQSWLGKLHLWWNVEVNGFYLRSDMVVMAEDEPMVILGCRYVRKDGRCGHHITRPVICRQWPLMEHYGYPRILDNCGYRLEVRRKRSN